MKKVSVVGIQHSLFKWARESMGLSIEEVSIKMKRNIDEIIAWEDGTDAPSYPQLEKLAYNIYKRPIAVFFLPEPPEETPPKKEFRTLPDALFGNLSSDTFYQIRKAHAYQLALKEIYNNVNKSQRFIWHDTTLYLNESIISQAKIIREHLNIDFQTQSAWKKDDIALKEWRTLIESVGIFVFKSSFKQKEISGFCLSDINFPLIYINNSTTKTRQIFSLLHELAHLLLNINGISKYDKKYIDDLPLSAQKIEIFCNAIAAEILMPSEMFQELTSNLPHNIENIDEIIISNIANKFSVSREAILRRFLEQKRVSKLFYRKKSKEWANQIKKGSGGDWYKTANVYLSEKFAKEVVSRKYRHEISIEKASDLLGIKAKNFSGLEQCILGGGIK